jgi:hypothetical protein
MVKSDESPVSKKETGLSEKRPKIKKTTPQN